MVLRKRAKLCELPPNVGLSKDAGTEESCSSNLTWFVKKPRAASEMDTSEASPLRRSNTCCSSHTCSLWPWQHCVSIAAGLLLAGLLALAQAWCVNSLHENLLWFAELTVRGGWLPVWGKFLKKEIYLPSLMSHVFSFSNHVFSGIDFIVEQIQINVCF